MFGDGLELLLSLDGAAYEMAPGVLVEFTVKRTAATPQHPHGISYSIVLRPKDGGTPWVRFDNAHRWHGAAAAAGVSPMTTGTGRSMTKDALMNSRRQCSCSMTFGGR